VNILIIEDEPELRAAFKEILILDGDHTIATAAHGREGLDYLRETAQLPDLILMDLLMPEMNGIQFSEERLKDKRLLSIPLILMSADSDFEKRCPDLRAAAFLHKPVDLSYLVKEVHRILKIV
jgi:CheY-like chemotaxis protein